MADAAVIAVTLNTALDRTLDVPGLALGGHVRGSLVSVQPAGKAVNVARLLDRLGVVAILTGFVGAGDRERFAESFAKTGVRIELFEGRGATRENITLVDPRAGTETHIRDEGFSLTDDDLARLEKKLRILAAPETPVAFAGSLPPGMTPDAFAALIEACRAKGARVAVDTSGPGLEAVRDRALWLVKPNLEELAHLAGRPVEDEAGALESARALRPRVEEVIVTLGAEGAILVTEAGAWAARPHPPAGAVVNTVGCGDALLAGFLRARVQGQKDADALAWGVACGTAAARCIRAGEVDPDVVELERKGVAVTVLDA